jgi:hypothetical protein
LEFFRNNDEKVNDDIVDQVNKLQIKDKLLMKGMNFFDSSNLESIVRVNAITMLKFFGSCGKLSDDSSGDTKLFTEDHVKDVNQLTIDNIKYLHWDGRTNYNHLNEIEEKDFRTNYLPLLIATHYIFFAPNNMSSKAEIGYKTFYNHLKDNLSDWLKYFGLNNQVWYLLLLLLLLLLIIIIITIRCERIVGILGNYATIVRQRGDNQKQPSDIKSVNSIRDFVLCQEILNIDKIILDRYTQCCRENIPDDSVTNEIEKFKQLRCLEGNNNIIITNYITTTHSSSIFIITSN